MRAEAVSRMVVVRWSLIGAGLMMTLNAAGCGESSVLSSLPDGGPARTGTGGGTSSGSGGDIGNGGAIGNGSGGGTGSGGYSGSGGYANGSGGYVGSGGSLGSGGYAGGDGGSGGAGGASPGWWEARMIGQWVGGDDALRITQCTGQMPTSRPLLMSVTPSALDGMLTAYDGEVCVWRIRVMGSTASVAPGSTCREVQGSDVLLFTVNELSLSSVTAWAGTVSGALTLTITGPTRTLDCTVSMQGRVTKLQP